mmetsp:Transcript_4958/g.12609  ORF Transcript_4958/g.12609 Transcript_4958/m.12609 type:complete len:96 (-) Transcript_4958:1771-2058(-)
MKAKSKEQASTINQRHIKKPTNNKHEDLHVKAARASASNSWQIFLVAPEDFHQPNPSARTIDLTVKTSKKKNPTAAAAATIAEAEVATTTAATTT